MNQDKIWDYFQQESQAMFLDSIPRLNFLFYQVKKRYGSTKPKILNIGVGDGWLERKCQEQGWETYSLDPSEGSIKKLKQSGIKAKVGYIENIPYQDSYFDVVFCSEVIEHLSNEQINQGLLEIIRILKLHGILIGTVPFNEDLSKSKVVCPNCGNVFHKIGHQQSFDIQSLAAIFPSHFKIEKLKEIYLIHWSSLNWKGIISSVFKKILMTLGVHGSNERLFFLVRKRN